VQKVKFSHWGSTGLCEFKYDMTSGRFNEYFGGVATFNNNPWIYSTSVPVTQTVSKDIIPDDGQGHVF